MRVNAAAVALCLGAAAIEGAAAYHEPSPRSCPAWGLAARGGDAPPSSSEPGDDDADDERERGAAGAMASSSQILNSVNAGGGFAANAPAFVGGRATTMAAASAASTLQKSPSATPEEESSSSLSVATDSRTDAEATNAGPEEPLPARKGPLKILFLSSDTGGGHRASAEALANQFQRHYPGTTYDLMDIWTDIDSSWPYNTIKDTYKSFSASPWKWRTLYHVSNTNLYSRFADAHSYYMNEEKIREKMEEYDPDVVVSVHPTMNYVPYYSIQKIAEKAERDIPFFTVVTDFGSGHCTWFNKEVDRLYLASGPIKKIAQDRGNVPDEKIVMSGLPIRYDFAAQADAMGGDRTSEQGKAHQAKIREKLNINPDKRMVLVMGGGEGVGSLSDIVNEVYAKLRTQGVDATICVVCGRNEKLQADLNARCWDTVVSQSLQTYESLRSRFWTKMMTMHAHRSRRIQLALDKAAAKADRGKLVAEVPGKVDVVPLGFVTNMAEYMVAADVLVSKAGPGTIAEAAAVGLPVMVTSHLPGQEAGNVDIVLNGGFGDFCEDPETIGLEVACWLQDSQLLDVMSEKARKVGQPHAAEEIALDIGETTHQWMERNELRRNGYL